MTKVLVTGASGFIGRQLVPELSNAGYMVNGRDSAAGDIADKSTWKKYPQAEVVIHLAGKSFVPDSWIDPHEFIKCNLQGTVAALDYCKKYRAKLIFLSSYLYGKPDMLPTPESAPLVAKNPYALSKKMAEEMCRFYSDSFDINITILRPFNVYGPGQLANFLIPTIIEQINQGELIKVKDLEPKRDYIYVSDLVQAILKTIECNRGLNIFNIGSGVSYSVGELIKTIQEIKGTNLRVYSEGERRKDEIMDTIADISEARKRLDWSPQWSLVSGLKQVLSKKA